MRTGAARHTWTTLLVLLSLGTLAGNYLYGQGPPPSGPQSHLDKRCFNRRHCSQVYYTATVCPQTHPVCLTFDGPTFNYCRVETDWWCYDLAFPPVSTVCTGGCAKQVDDDLWEILDPPVTCSNTLYHCDPNAGGGPP
jgi:hypothetical protein